MFSEAGLYGTRVTVLERDLAHTTLPNYFADLIVSSKSLEYGKDCLDASEISRLQRPFGGKVCLGKPGNMTVSERGPLEGTGVWTHLYCTPGNVNCSTDTMLKGPLGMLWFEDNDLEMPSRHGRGPGPLFEDGILLVEGIHELRALDAYNGRVLWTYPLPNILKIYDQEHLNGVAITGSNFCIGEGRVYVRKEDICLCLDMKTGRKLAEFKAPYSRMGTQANGAILPIWTACCMVPCSTRNTQLSGRSKSQI